MFIAVLNIRSKRNKGENCMFEFCSFQRKEIKKFHPTSRNGGPGKQLLAARRPKSMLRAQGSLTRSAFATFCLSSLRAQGNVRGMARSQQQHNVAKLRCDNWRRSGDGSRACHLVGRSQPLASQDIDLKNSPMQKKFS